MSESNLPPSKECNNPPLKKLPNPLYGLKLDKLLTDISEHYTWLSLSDVLNIERLQFHTGLKSTMKFLRNHEWAKEKVENFYLYCFKNYAWPDDKQLAIPPRDRSVFYLTENDHPAPISDEMKYLIEHASDVRHVAKNNSSKNKVQKEEPAYDPSNPWNK
ncbi:VF530 family DNA-binding protein [Psychromonas sp. KJ10-10]|uniref:VF530 family DNA-binding protein n=1 Tax=Psychromonas sp. KJ10-10 TaxID=3391823 RepID=UPI0039B4201F